MAVESNDPFVKEASLKDSDLSSFEDFAKSYLKYTINILESLNSGEIAGCIKIIDEIRRKSKQVFIAGNGGSAATASHMANDFLAGPRWARGDGLKVTSLADNVSVLTALANDHGYDHVFDKQLDVLGSEGDCLIVISASGNSANLINAVVAARQMGIATIGILGFDGGSLSRMVDHAIIVKTPVGDYGPVEDAHMVLDHLIGAALIKISGFA